MVNITGMILLPAAQKGGQLRRNHKIPFNKTGMVSMPGMSGQLRKSGWSRWAGLYTLVENDNN
jgi:hypothetical protein